MFSRRIVFHGGVAGVAATLASCGFSDADAPERGNDYEDARQRLLRAIANRRP